MADEFRCIGTAIDEIVKVLAEFLDEPEEPWVDELAEQVAYRLRDKGYLADDI